MRPDMSNSPADTQADLAALADGNLPAERVAEVERLVQSSPQLAEELQLQRHVALLLGRTETSAPASLQHTIAAMATDRRSRRATPVRWSFAGVAALASAAAVALVLALTSSTSGLPSVTQASKLALRPATVASPTENPSDHALLATSVDGIAYPYWGKRFGWKTDGARTDRLAGRTITTVFYANSQAQRIGYSIVDGDALAQPTGQTVERHGVSFRVLQAGGATVLTWRRAGHTCILTARDVPSKTLLALASWQRS
jgi:anti-sigma factor RsiW